MYLRRADVKHSGNTFTERALVKSLDRPGHHRVEREHRKGWWRRGQWQLAGVQRFRSAALLAAVVNAQEEVPVIHEVVLLADRCVRLPLWACVAPLGGGEAPQVDHARQRITNLGRRVAHGGGGRLWGGKGAHAYLFRDFSAGSLVHSDMIFGGLFS